MKKFDRLLLEIERYTEISLDLADFGLKKEQLENLIEKLNINSTIKILILNHNSLGDDSIPNLIKLTNIESLELSYNNFTQKGIDTLREGSKNKSLKIYANHNNTKKLSFS